MLSWPGGGGGGGDGGHEVAVVSDCRTVLLMVLPSKGYKKID